MPEIGNAECCRGAGVKTWADSFLHRIDPECCDSEVSQIVQMQGQAFQIAAMKGARVVAFYFQVIRRVSVNVAIDEHEIQNVIRPVSCRPG